MVHKWINDRRRCPSRVNAIEAGEINANHPHSQNIHTRTQLHHTNTNVRFTRH